MLQDYAADRGLARPPAPSEAQALQGGAESRRDAT
jgi:hypothetical protein